MNRKLIVVLSIVGLVGAAGIGRAAVLADQAQNAKREAFAKLPQIEATKTVVMGRVLHSFTPLDRPDVTCYRLVDKGFSEFSCVAGKLTQ